MVGSLCVAWFLAAVLADIFQCSPVHAAFNPKLMFSRHCINLQQLHRGITAAILGLDLIILVLPLYMVGRLSLRRREKIMLSLIFLLGGI